MTNLYKTSKKTQPDEDDPEHDPDHYGTTNRIFAALIENIREGKLDVAWRRNKGLDGREANPSQVGVLTDSQVSKH